MALTMRQARATQWRSTANSAKSRIHPGGSTSRSTRLAAWVTGRLGWFVQHRLHSPGPFLRRSSPHCEHARGGSGGGAGREQVPHQPVAGRMNPGRLQRGQIERASAAATRRRQSRQRVASLYRTM